ncbi:unnamed protein product [Brachionus calyciflorus]|uniref:EGF-like domain-containing protein n=1 Tax=Brachionus calyciflorus TaxID=104777 RepID=A0A813ZZ93_9BILA|nr:unnamed protein product [Brachionus calyciflorus]
MIDENPLLKINQENPKKTIYEYKVNVSKDAKKPYSNKFLINPSAIGFGIETGLDPYYKRIYGQHCKIDSDCDSSLGLLCQNDFCNCSSSTFYNTTKMLCVAKILNSIPCSNDNDCCCGQKCVLNNTYGSKLCSCPIDRWWNKLDSFCKKRSYFNESCSSISECWLGANLTCLNSKCACSDANLNFWNGTFCSQVESYFGSCKIPSGCNQTQGLVCNLTEQMFYKCVCPSYNYWDSSLKSCLPQKNNTQACSSTDQCRSGTSLYCDTSSTNTCKCPIDYYWSTNTCVKMVSYGSYCNASIQCNTNLLLSCVNSYCVCTASKFWDGTLCVVPITSGINCNNSYSCDASLGLSCDSTFKQCVCATTHYWTGSTCKIREINGTWCTQTLQCQTQNGLSCTTNRCFCPPFYYWSGTKCLLRQTVNTNCLNTYECQDYNGLRCINLPGRQTCECLTDYYWDGSSCVPKLTHGTLCTFDSECDNTKGLICGVTCKCPFSYYWSGSTCTAEKTHTQSCDYNYECKRNLNLLCIGTQCSCMPLMHWDGTKCVFKQTNGASCTSIPCQNYARLSCIANTCQCSSPEYWVTNKCQRPVGINQYCDGTTYKCQSGLECQGTGTGNYLCQCALTSYWNGASCVPLKGYRETCDGWEVPCDYSKQLKCLTTAESTSCYQGFAGKQCTCISTDYWDGTKCVDKKLNKISNTDTCQCRQDLGLERRAYDSTYTCYTNAETNFCACSSTTYWGGEKCIPKKTKGSYCVNSCECQENLGGSNM